MSSAVQDLLAILDLESLEVNLFRGRSPQVGWQRVFGGQVIGQALVAACRTLDVAGRPPHSLHAYFLLAGDTKVPIVYDVDRINDGRFHVWIRATGALPDEPAIHQCVLAYASDMMLLDSALIPHGRTVFEKELVAASLDHALWFHRPFRADDWLLYAQDSPNLSGSRGFSRGLIFARDGTLVASVAQEGLLRQRKILRSNPPALVLTPARTPKVIA